MKGGHAPQPPRCSLARIIAEPMDVEVIKAQGWQEQEILVVALNDPGLNMVEREFVKLIGDKKYGKKRGR